ncbi:hypothetical protein PW52_15000 [Tamlana sedimentorum]|uniref:Uncharacterized protein n=2 Tax=Neotamlana sedimentorum TaxID=1435349 RepID=A0A0D7W0Y6_9FLAO|nr:hypothetical protein PW52_15000 [Tamlana sedimentorum]
MLILYILRKINKKSNYSKKLVLVMRRALKSVMLITLFIVATSFTKEAKPLKNITYNIVRNQTVIGTISISSIIKNDSEIYSLESHINIKYILKFCIKGEETSIYKNGILVYSSVFRKVNNKIKADHDVVYRNKNYHEINSGHSKKLSLKIIQDNLVMLYLKEPKYINTVYCDYIKQMVKVEALGMGKYKVDFLDGKYNIFHYKKGKCVKVEANSSLFNVTLIPVKS